MWIFLGPEHNILRSTASTLGTFIIKDDISAFFNRVICLNHYAHASHLPLAPEWKTGDKLAFSRQTSCVFTPWKAIFQDPIIVYGSTFVVTRQQIPQPIPTAALCLMVFQFLAYILCCLLQTVYVPVKNVYFSPATSYMFRYSLHHLQGEHCFNCSKTIRFLQCCYKM